MAVVISESSSSTGTTTFPSPSPSTLFLPSHQRLQLPRTAPTLFGEVFGEQPTLAQVRLNKLTAEAFHGESSTELRNEGVGVAAVRALVNFGINQGRMDVRHDDDSTQLMQMEDVEESSMEKDEWKSIQDYGEYLGKTVDTFQYTDFVMEPASVQPVTIPERRRWDSLFEWFSWRTFRFKTEFAQLAPLTTRENRIHAQQSAKLSDWILDWGNDIFFGWQSLGQVVAPPPQTEETRRQREIAEHTALQQILHVIEDPPPATSQQGGIRPALDGTPERAQSSFARYLSQEAPPGFTMTERSGGIEPSRSNSNTGSEEDTRSVVSQDNHWRRTIFG